jgi:peptide/nickel transport system substrate-binding protein
VAHVMFIVLAILTAAVSPPAQAENILRWASGTPPQTFDPYVIYENPTIVAQAQVYEGLVFLNYNARGRVEPLLAVTWELLDPLTWEFKLREDVRFQDGTPLTAEDVAFSIERAKAETAGASFREDVAGSIAHVTVVDAHTVRVATKASDFLLWGRVDDDLPIMSENWARSHGATTPTSFKDAGASYATRHANGTGPFILEEFEPRGRYVLVRNPDWWGTELHPHNIDRIVYTPIGDPEERLDALLTGRIDFVPDPPYAALDRIRTTPGLKLERTTSLRSIFLGLDQGSAELRSSDVKGRNPFKDKRVRRAMYQAIDVGAIRDQVMNGFAEPAGMFVAPGVGGYEPELDQRLPFDPRTARALLAEAGYPDGFRVTLDCPNNRWINDEAICRAVAAQLGTVGIKVTVAARPKDQHFRTVYDLRQSDFHLASWAVGSQGSQQFFRVHYLSSSHDNDGVVGYSNPRVDELIEAIDAATVTYARDAFIEEVWKIVLDDVVYIPLHREVVVWAMRENLNIPVNPFGDSPYFYKARFMTSLPAQ